MFATRHFQSFLRISRNRLPRHYSTAQFPPVEKFVLYVDKNVLVLNKPTGLICQLGTKRPRKDEPIGREEAKEEVEITLDDLLSEERLHLPEIPRHVHRLDKRTTGALALAVTANHAKELSRQFAQHTVSKTYLALVRGGEKSFPTTSGTIDSPLLVDEDGRVYLVGSNKSEAISNIKPKAAITDWELICSSPVAPVSLVKLSPTSGVKHQLRVHMAHGPTHTPILGDTLYASQKLSSQIKSLATISPELMYLHASSISYYRYRPFGKRVRFGINAPLPGYFTKLCSKLNIHLDRDIVKGGLYLDDVRVDNIGENEIVNEWDGRWLG
ncbi:pseudouridine synthase [Abortiporus biennis]|nr:pseudouridine synthase [Abortiporus biennis]